MSKFKPEQHPTEPDRLYVAVDDKFDVRIVRTDEGIGVDIYPYNGIEAVASTYAFDSDVEPEHEEGVAGPAQQPAEVMPQSTFQPGQYVTIPSGMGGSFSARVEAVNEDGTYQLKVLNADFEEYQAPRIQASDITPMDAAAERYWRGKERQKRERGR